MARAAKRAHATQRRAFPLGKKAQNARMATTIARSSVFTVAPFSLEC